MKTLITAADIKKLCDLPDKTLTVAPKTIITPAAKDAARECGIRIIFAGEQAVAAPAVTPLASAPQAQPLLSASPAQSQAGVTPALIAQIVQEVLSSMQLGGKEPPADKIADPSGMRLVRGDSVIMEDYPTGSAQDKIKMKDLFTAKESPHMSAGFMSLDDTAFTTEPAYEEIAYVLDGTVECIINGRKYTGRSGDTFYLPANTKITLSTMGKAKLFYVTYPAKRTN